MARTAHQSVGEFYLRPPIAGLKVLDGVTAVRDSFENPSPANGRTVLAALRLVVSGESPYVGLHKTQFFLVTALVKTLERISAVTGAEGGDLAADVAAKVRAALSQNSVLAAFFAISGTGAAVVLTANVRAANDATMNGAFTNGTATGLTPNATSANTTAGVVPVAQVETATVVATVTGSGNASVVVTAAGMTGSPKTIPVAVLNGDDANAVATKIRAALAADSAVSALFTVSGATSAVILTRTAPSGVADDGTLNIAIATGTATGITAAPTSANTTAGVAGVAQVETITIVGTPTTDGSVIVTITAAGMTGSPIVFGVLVEGSSGTDVLITDAVYAAAKADSVPAEQSLRAALVVLAADYIPGFTGVGISIAGRF